MEVINQHRSIRKYSNKEISNDLLKKLVEEAERTQTMGNLQLYSVVITRTEEMKKATPPVFISTNLWLNRPKQWLLFAQTLIER